MSELEILNAALAIGWVKFSYTKADGTKRVAIGTRNRTIIENILGRQMQPKRTENYYKHCNGYFDLIRVDWRQFNSDRFIGIERESLTNEEAICKSINIALEENLPTTTIDSIEVIACRLVGEPIGRKVVTDSKAMWCYKHNNGRGLNGVLLSAAGTGGSGCLGWPSMSGHASKSVSPKEFECATTRSALIAELNALRKREDEILSELLA